jgi:hypothetical protein
MRALKPYLPFLTILSVCVAIALAVFDVIPHEHIGMLLVTAPFAVNPELTAVAIGYKNTEDTLIADIILPRVPTAEKFKYTVYDKEQAYTLPDTKVGRKSEPNQVEFKGTEVPAIVEDYGLDDFVPNRDMEVFDAMPKGGNLIDPKMLSTMMLTNLIQLRREKSAADIVFAAGTYPAGQKTVVSDTAADQWNDFVNSDPLKQLLAALDAMFVRANTLVLGNAVWTQLRQHPKVVQAIFKTAQGAGSVSRQQLADHLEISQVVVGGSRVNTAKKGQAATLVRTWGKHAALLYVSKIAAETFQPTFGFTAQFGDKIAGEIPEPKKGLTGGVIVRVGERVKEVISASDAGYFFQNAIA